MIQLYDLNHNKIQGLVNYKDLKNERTLDGEEVLSFSYPQNDSKYNYIREEGYIRTKKNEYVIKEINVDDDWTEFVAKLNLEDLKGNIVNSFETKDQTCTDAINLALVGTGWSIGTCDVVKKRSVKKANCSSYVILKEIKDIYRCNFRFDAINKKIYIYQSAGINKGTYFTDELNLKKLRVQSNSYDYCTRIIPKSKDADIKNLNGGKEYVENYQYSTKIITIYWEDNRYTNDSSLLEDAQAKLEELSKPIKSYSVDVIDLAKFNAKYNILEFDLGDAITLISKDKMVRDTQIIVKITEYPDEPERNSCEIANRTLKFEDLQAENQSVIDSASEVITSDGGLDGSKVDSIDANTQIKNLYSEVARITNLTVVNADIENLKANKADIQSLTAVTARIGTLEVTTATITQLNAVNAKIDNLNATYATIENLNATNAKINSLSAVYASIDNLNATNARIDNLVASTATVSQLTAVKGYITDLQSSKANITDLTASNGRISNLESNTANINTLLAGNLSATNMQAGFITASSGLIANGAIKDAMIDTLSVAKILAGDISTSKFRIVSSSGNMLIFDNTMQIKDANRVRIQIGKDASNDYNMYVWDSSGSLMFDATGLKASGIKSKIIRDDMVSDTANINGSKIEKESLITQINGATSTLKASKIKLDTENQTLDVAFTGLKSTVSNHEAIITSQGTSISTIQGQISTKIWSSDITTAVNSIQVGGINLIRNADFKSTAFWSGFSSSTTSDYLGKNSLTVSRTNYTTGGRQQLLQAIQQLPSLVTGSTYTINAWLYVDSSISLDTSTANNFVVRVYKTDNTNYIDYNIVDLKTLITNTWVHVYKTFTLTSDSSNTNKPMLLLSLNQNGLVKICMPKFESGNRATDFSVAPEDTQVQIDNANSNITTINTNYSNLNQTVSSITANVSTLQTTTSNLGTRMTSAESSITALNSSIVLKVATSDFNSYKANNDSVVNSKASQTDLNSTNTNVVALATRVSSTESSISVLQNQIVLKVTQTDIDNSIDSIDIGSRNLIKNSIFSLDSNGLRGWTNSGLTSVTGNVTATNVPYNATYSVLYNTNTAEKFLYALTSIPLQPNTTYTLSFYYHNDMVGGTSTGDFFVLGQKSATTGSNYDYIHAVTNLTNTNSKWIYKTVTFTTAGDEIKCIIRLDNNGSTSGSIRFTLLQLEEGNKATSWTPAPEDTQGQIDSATTRISTAESNITQLSNSITLKVDTSTYTSKMSSLDSSISSLDSRLDTAELKITDSSIISTVRSSTAYASDLGGKANQSDLNNTNTNVATAQNTANLKRRVFTATPTTPYDIGDLWSQGTTGELMKCKAARASGSYTATDWEKASKYTDDTTANTVQGNLNTTNSNLNSLTTRVSTAESSITQLNSSITLKVNISDFNNLTTRVSTAESSISILQGQISSKVNVGDLGTLITQNSTSVRTAVGQIGGENLVKNGRGVLGTASWVSTTSSITNELLSDLGIQSIKLGNSTTNEKYMDSEDYIYVKPNTTYTVSYLVWVQPSIAYCKCRIYSSSSTILKEGSSTVYNNKYNLVTFTFNTGSYTKIWPRFLVGSVSSGTGYVWLTDICMREGDNPAQSWSPNANELKNSFFEITEDHARFTNDDGSYTEFTPGTTGLKWHNANLNYDYHYLSYMNEATVSYAYPYTVTLPAVFKGKDFKIMIGLKAASAVTEGFISYMSAYVSNIDTTNGTFKINGYVQGNGYALNKMYDSYYDQTGIFHQLMNSNTTLTTTYTGNNYLPMTVSYLVIA